MKKILWLLMMTLAVDISAEAQTAVENDDSQEAIAVTSKLFALA